jgi:hypothetical protein
MVRYFKVEKDGKEVYKTTSLSMAIDYKKRMAELLRINVGLTMMMVSQVEPREQGENNENFNGR